MAAGEVVSPVRPFWLDLVDSRFVPNAKAAWVAQLFRWAANGLGCHRVSGLCARRGWSFKRAAEPTQTVVWRLLKDRKVLGECQCYLGRDEQGRRRPVGEAIKGYYPVIAEEGLFSRVQAVLERRRKVGRGRQAEAVPNLSAGLLVDGRDNSPVHVSRRSKRKYRYLVSYAALTGRAPCARPLRPNQDFPETPARRCTSRGPVRRPGPPQSRHGRGGVPPRS
jgi:hypothetical protein